MQIAMRTAGSERGDAQRGATAHALDVWEETETYSSPLPEGRLNPAMRGLRLALIASLLLHAGLLSLKFRLPDVVMSKLSDTQLEVVLVNRKSARQPDDPQAKAQADLDGGGNTMVDRRAATPLPPAPNENSGDEPVQMQARPPVEERHPDLLAMRAKPSALPVETQQSPPQPDPAPAVSGTDLKTRALAMARGGVIALQAEESNKGLRRKQITARTVGVSYAMYYGQWREKIERVGSNYYPSSAKGQVHSVMVTVSVREDGSVENVEIERSSGNKELDRHVRRIVDLAAPFARFSPAMRSEYRVYDIISTWTFTPGGSVSAVLRK